MPPRLAAAGSAAVLATLLSTTAVPAQPAPDGAQTGVAVTRVTLATGGLAEVEGRMTAPADTMRLAIEVPQVADVLRTLVVTGPAAAVSVDLPAAEPVGERSQTGRLLAGDLADPATVLSELIGAEVVLRGGPNQLSGRLLAFSLVDLPAPPARDGEVPPPARPGVRAAVATPDGRVAYATFPTLDQLSIEGDPVAARMSGVLPALAQTVDDSRRELTVRLAGPAEAGFNFVVPTTVWRPSYRAVVAADGKVTLEGWGTLENTTGFDWNDIDLRLAVGTPVAYAQDVYSPLRADRPFAPFEVGRTVETGIVPPGSYEFAQQTMAADAAAAEPAPAPMAARAELARGIARPMAKSAGVVTGEPAVSGTAATLFNVAGKIDLAAGRTLSVPFLSGDQKAERITYLDFAAGRQPMDALELAFAPDATVPGGLVAVFDESGFIGDARFAGADGGVATILPFAVTADVDATTADDTRTTFASAALRSGGLTVTRDAVTRTAIRIEARADTTVVADIPAESGERVEANVSNGAPVSVNRLDTGRTRLRVRLPAGSYTLAIVRTRPLSEYYSVSNIPTYIIEEVLAEGGKVDDATKARLTELAAVARRIDAINAEIATLEADVRDLREAVANDRDNLEAIDVRTPEGAGVRRRIIERTDRIDAALEQLSRLRRDLDAETARLRG